MRDAVFPDGYYEDDLPRPPAAHPDQRAYDRGYMLTAALKAAGINEARDGEKFDVHLRRTYGIQDAPAMLRLVRIAVRTLPTSREKLALIAGLNFIKDGGSEKADFRRTYVMKTLDVSYSTALRLEQAGMRQLFTMIEFLSHYGELVKSDNEDAMVLVLDDLETKFIDRIFAVTDDEVQLWPDWAAEGTY